MQKAMTEQTIPFQAGALFGARDNVTGATTSRLCVVKAS
jgi:hypothetical protein